MERCGPISKLNLRAQNALFRHTEARICIPPPIVSWLHNHEFIAAEKNQGGVMGMVFVRGISPRNILPA